MGTNDMITNTEAPMAAKWDAPDDAVHRFLPTNDTTRGLIISPKLPPLAIKAFANVPASNHLTAINNKNVAPAVSSIPAATARHFS